MVDKKTKFRARKLDYGRSLKVIDAEELLGIGGEGEGEALMDGSPLRTAPLVSTGVDKEEEEEEHLQEALMRALVVPKTQSYVIPTPHVEEIRAHDWEPLYPTVAKKRKTEEPLVMLAEGYCADEEDMRIAQDLSLPIDTLERLYENWEKGQMNEKLEHSGVEQSGVSENVLETVHAKWQEKRQNGRLVLGSLKHEDLDKIGADPYVCFRRRELKLPRKTRRSDAQCVEKLRKMRYELEALTSGLEMLVRRDEWRRSGLEVEAELFLAYRQLRPEERTRVPAYRTAISRRASERENNRRKLIQMTPSAGSTHPLHKPYYPSVDVSSLIIQEIESLMGRIKLPSLSDDDDEYDDDEREYYARGSKVQARIRKGRAGRILVERRQQRNQQFLPFSTGAPAPLFSSTTATLAAPITTSSVLSLKECAQLNNAAVGNYNQHYLAASNGLLMPYSFFHWVSLSNEHGLAPNNNNSSSNNHKTTANSAVGNSPNKKQKTGALTTTKLTTGGSNNITVKVKTRSSIEGSADSGSSSPYQPLPPTQQPAQAHFTPTGLHRNTNNNNANAAGGNKT